MSRSTHSNVLLFGEEPNNSVALDRVVSLNAVQCTLVRVVLQEMQSVSSASDTEKLLLYHGERIVDLLGAEINQIVRFIQVNISLLAYTVLYKMYSTCTYCTHT